MIIAFLGMGVGALIGGLVGFFGPFALAQLYVLLGGDEMAAGAFSFFPLVTVPLGVFVGAICGIIISGLFLKAFARRNSLG